MVPLKKKQRQLPAADLRLWAAYTQTLHLLPGRHRLPYEPDPLPDKKPPAPSLAAPPAAKERKQDGLLAPDLTPTGIDKSTWKKFATGKIRAERRLDLHGHTAARAHLAVTAFIARAHADQTRCIEIITGKGEVLIRELPHWLNAPNLRPYILAIAHPHAANTGSVRLLLRRAR
jgi:DNA-nicking Smr family endonuclease